MDSVLTAMALPGKGLAGNADRSRTRQVTIIEREVWDRLMKETAGKAPPAARRANMMVSGISLANSRDRVLQVGIVRFRIAGETRPCERMEEVHAGLQASMSVNWGGGVFAQVLDEGNIVVGDTVVWAGETVRFEEMK
jgi:MOSC domain-containing protein YiiM